MPTQADSSAEQQPERPENDDEASSSTSNLLPEEVRVDAKRAAIGGALAAAVTLLGAWLVGAASGAEAHLLLETALPQARSFCGTVTIALGNVLALMLTLLSLSTGADADLKWAHYQRVKQVAWIDALTLIAAVLIYLLLNIPLGKADAAGAPGVSYGSWYAGLYYTTLVLTSLLGGALISVVLMLYNTVRDLIRAIGPDQKSRLTREKEEAEQEAREAREEAREAKKEGQQA